MDMNNYKYRKKLGLYNNLRILFLLMNLVHQTKNLFIY